MQQALQSLQSAGLPGYAAVGSGFLAIVFLIAGLLSKRKISLLETRLEALRKDNEKLRSGPQTWEYRIERFDVVWFPMLTTAPATREITQLNAGLPHCPSCVRPLGISGHDGEWACSKCQAKFAGSLADLAVTDVVNKQALRYFQERHPDYTPGKGVGQVAKR